MKNQAMHGAARPSVSIAIPTFRRPDLLAETIRSALAQQGFDDFEVLVVDNESDPDHPQSAAAVCLQFADAKLRYHRNESNLGMTGNWNACLSLAKGRWMSLLHDDDLLAPDFLSQMFSTETRSLLLMCEVIVGSTPPRFADQEELRGPARREAITRSDLLFSRLSPAPGFIFHRQQALALGGFRAEFYPCADYDFWARFCLAHAAERVCRTLAFYRIGANESLRIDTRFEIARQALAIRRSLAKDSRVPAPVSDLAVRWAMNGLLDHYAQNPRFLQDPRITDWLSAEGLPLPTSGLLPRIATKLSRIAFTQLDR